MTDPAFRLVPVEEYLRRELAALKIDLYMT